MDARRFLGSTALIALLTIGISSRHIAAADQPIALHVDATHAQQGYFDVHESMTVAPGPVTLVYSRWIPGTHAPNGPIPNVVDIKLSTGGTELSWQRDPIDLYAFHAVMPAGATSLDVDFRFLGNALSGYAAGPSTTTSLMALEWWKVVLSPQADNYAAVTIAPSVTLPAGWSSATALETSSTDGSTVAYKPVSLERLFDSPLDAGRYSKVVDLGTWDGAPLALAIFADVPSSLAVDAKTQDELRAIVAQMHALYVHRHFNHYTFLLTLTDVFGNGLEHHQSSDNGSSPDFFTSPTSLTAHASLLTHEFNHSWDGKYRRPAGLATPNLQVPMIDDLLWVYEGMTQYYGELVAERAGFRTAAQWRDQVAGTLAYYSNEPGRNTATLEDTARASSIRRGFSAWSSERRSQDYYSEGLLIWLEADELIREHSGGRKSLDDYARAFFGDGADTAPMVKPYTRENLIAGLEKIDPYDWAGFFAKRVDAIAPLPPDVLAHGGYRLAFAPKPSEFEKIQNGESKGVDAWYSLGFNVRAGALSDVRLDSPAGNAGLAPGDKLVAVNGRTFTGSPQLDTALTEAKDGSGISFIVSRDDAFMTVKIDYRAGPRYPYAERAPSEPDILNAIAKPLN